MSFIDCDRNFNDSDLMLKLLCAGLLASDIADADTTGFTDPDMECRSVLNRVPSQLLVDDRRPLGISGLYGADSIAIYRLPAQISLDCKAVEKAAFAEAAISYRANY